MSLMDLYIPLVEGESPAVDDLAEILLGSGTRPEEFIHEGLPFSLGITTQS